MKRLIARLLPALLLISLTACAMEPTDFPSNGAPPLDGIASEGESAPPEEPTGDANSDGGAAPDSGASALDGLASAPAYAIYPEDGALDNLPEDGAYTSKDDVALYLYGYGHLPDNFITKQEARGLGWSGGGLDPYAPGMCIGGDRFGNYEGILPDVEGRTYYECDIDTLHASSRGAKRLVFCWETDEDNRQVYYTEDHYESFELVYGDDAPDA